MLHFKLKKKLNKLTCNLTFVVFRSFFLRLGNEIFLGFVLLLSCHALADQQKLELQFAFNLIIFCYIWKPIGYLEGLVNVSWFSNLFFPICFSWFPLEEMIWYRSFVLWLKIKDRHVGNRHLRWEKSRKTRAFIVFERCRSLGVCRFVKGGST